MSTKPLPYARDTQRSSGPDAIKHWVLEAAQTRATSFYEKYGKRAFDLVFATTGVIITAPIVVTAAVAVKCETPGPALFRQTRVGQGASHFTIYKLRTMREGNTSSGEVLPDNPDTTKVGSVLRRLKIDEIPQLYNVVRGDMSLVGPRPLLPSMLTDVDEVGRYRFLVRPGLTGHAQTNGNVSLSWPDRWSYDRRYVEKLSFSFDAKILAKTVLVVLLGEDRFKKKGL